MGAINFPLSLADSRRLLLHLQKRASESNARHAEQNDENTEREMFDIRVFDSSPRSCAKRNNDSSK